MAKKTKFFRVAVEGVTTDGREITRDWIQQMAATYNPEKYGARVFAEHIRGAVPDGPFRALGDVTALKAEPIADGALKGKLALYAQIDPSDAMVKLVNSGQKIYSSIEVDSAFADTKQAYLVGLGITDSPASLGTEVLAFAAQHPDASPFKGRKQKPENLFSAAVESAIELEPETPAEDPAAGFFKTLTDVLAKFAGKSTAQPTVEAAPASTPAVVPGVSAADITQGFTAVSDALKAFSTANQTALDALRSEVKADRERTESAIAKINETLDATPANFKRRPPATGGNGAVLTDC